MLKMIISGCNGRMGRALYEACRADGSVSVTAGFDANPVKLYDFPVYADPMEFGGGADVLVDFSNPSALKSLLSYCGARRLPSVFCTTGYTPEQVVEIEKLSASLPVFRSANMSMGINLLLGLVKEAAAALGEDFDVEIVEKHHNKKLDAPSGTALMLADAVSEGESYAPEYVYERRSVRRQRAKNEIGISAVRGGNIPGEHEVIFAGTNEVIEFRHTVYSREVFASGALRAAKFLAAQTSPGLYNMSDALFKK